MSSARRNDKEVPITVYEKQKLENIARNKEKLQALNLPIMSTIPQPGQPSKRRKLMVILCDQGHKEILVRLQMCRL